MEYDAGCILVVERYTTNQQEVSTKALASVWHITFQKNGQKSVLSVLSPPRPETQTDQKNGFQLILSNIKEIWDHVQVVTFLA